MTVFIMNYQPVSLDAPIMTYWHIADCDFSFIAGVIQSGRMTFDCYESEADIGNPVKKLDSKIYDFNLAEISAFQVAANLTPGQIAAIAYGFAQFIKDVQTGTDESGNPIMASFFAPATLQ